MTKQELFQALNKEYEEVIVTFRCCQAEEDQKEDIPYKLKVWTVGELLCDLTTYCDDYSETWYKNIVETVRQIYTKCFDHEKLDYEHYMLCFNLLQKSGWSFDWGTNIYTAWMEWGDNAYSLCFDNKEVKVTPQVLDYLFEWLDA
jgi:hypothetical protein